MKVFLTLGLIASAIVSGQTLEEKKDESAFSRLPIGATLTNVSIPRFDPEKRRASLLTARIMEVKSADNLRGEDLIVRLFDKEQKVSTTATMAAANYLIVKEQLIANGELIMRSTNKKFLARSQGGILSMNSRQGLLGPSEIMFVSREKKKKITMNQIKPVLPLLASVQLLAAAPPPLPTTEELVAFERLTAPVALPPFDGPQLFEATQLAEAKLDQRLTTFMQAVGPEKVAEQQKATPKPEKPFEDLFKPGKDQIIAKSDKGFYFDGPNYAAMFFGKVSLSGRGMTMTCNNGMKTLLAEPPKKEKSEGENKDDSPFADFNGIGELKQFVAVGNVSVKGRDKKGNLIEARGDRAVYDAEKQMVIIRGDGIGFRMGGSGFRTKDKNAYVVLHILPNDFFSLRSEGNWEIGLSDRFKKK